MDSVERGVLAPVFVLRGKACWTSWEERGGCGSHVQPLFPCRHPTPCRLQCGGRLGALTMSAADAGLAYTPKRKGKPS